MASVWTVERVALLRALWADGVPGGVIAKRLGMTRGMVAGKRHSLGLPRREGEVAAAAQSRNARRTAELCEVPGSRAYLKAIQLQALAEVALERISHPLPGSSPRPWELRRRGECAFPVEGAGAETLSCCEPVAAGCGYCLGHKAMLAGKPWPVAVREMDFRDCMAV